MPQRRDVDYQEYAGQIVSAIPKGVLLTTKAEGRVNTMTIGWGALGTNWSVPMFEAFIRLHRHTVSLLDKNPEFTVNVPLGDFDRKIVGFCGNHHGDEVDKVGELGLTLVDSRKVDVPGIAQLPLTLECKVVYRQPQELDLYTPDVRERFYPQDVDGRAVGANRDPHIMVFGQIVNAYVIEE